MILFNIIKYTYNIGRPLSSVCMYVCMHSCMHVCLYVCMSTFSNIFSSETTGPFEAKFNVEPTWDGRLKICSNGIGHMTKIAAVPIYGKNLKTSSSPEPKGRWPWNLVCSIGFSSTTKFVQMIPWVDLDLFKGKVKFGPLRFCIEKR